MLEPTAVGLRDVPEWAECVRGCLKGKRRWLQAFEDAPRNLHPFFRRHFQTARLGSERFGKGEGRHWRHRDRTEIVNPLEITTPIPFKNGTIYDANSARNNQLRNDTDI